MSMTKMKSAGKYMLLMGFAMMELKFGLNASIGQKT